MTLVPAAIAAAMFAVGVYLLLQRTLTRIVIGLGLLGNAANLLLLVVGGRAGNPPIVGSYADGEPVADPLPQALALTAIVIAFGVTTFLLALAYRSWTLQHSDDVEDDVEDRRIARLAARERHRRPPSEGSRSRGGGEGQP